MDTKYTPTMSSFNVKADLVPLFRGLVTGLQPFASAQQVSLEFRSAFPSIYASYNPAEALSEITLLLSRIVSFTPQSYKVKVTLGKNRNNPEECILIIENNGVDLSRLGEILSSVKTGLQIEKLEKGTRFIVQIPITDMEMNSAIIKNSNNLLPKQYPRYFVEISKRLTSHFSNINNIRDAARYNHTEEGIFLKKVNALINSHLSDPEFKVDALASSMAISRIHLFRKLKAITGLSPQAYIRIVRLEEAKRLLQSKKEDLNVSEVCYRVGFSSKSHFTRSFQKAFGLRPSELNKVSM